MGLAKAREQQRHVYLARGKQGADRDPPRDEPLDLVDVALDALDLGEDPPRTLGDRAPGVGGDDAAAGALEELDAQLGLEPAHLVRERGLRDVQLLRGAGEVAMPVDGLDVPELAQLHA